MKRWQVFAKSEIIRLLSISLDSLRISNSVTTSHRWIRKECWQFGIRMKSTQSTETQNRLLRRNRNHVKTYQPADTTTISPGKLAGCSVNSIILIFTYSNIQECGFRYQKYQNNLNWLSHEWNTQALVSSVLWLAAKEAGKSTLKVSRSGRSTPVLCATSRPRLKVIWESTRRHTRGSSTSVRFVMPRSPTG